MGSQLYNFEETYPKFKALEKAVREVQRYLNPQAQHMLDWFPITMRITVLGQFMKGLVQRDAEIGGDMEKALESTKWNLWHGKVEAALEGFSDVEMLMYNFMVS